MPSVRRLCYISGLLLGTGIWLVGTDQVAGAEQRVTIADGRLEITVPQSWAKREPRVRIIELEFLLPKAERDAVDGRLTMMAAGGSAQDNIDRWLEQFQLPPGSTEEGKGDERVKVEKVKAGELEVQVVDVSGTYLDRPGPFAPGVERPNYRMIGAIVPLSGTAHYFLKFYGPQATVEKHAEDFMKAVKSLRKK